MGEVPRDLFVPEHVRDLAYEDTPLHIGYGQTISAPSMVGVMCDILDIRETDKVLEVGTGCGYHAAVMSRLASRGTVYTVERIPELAERAKALLRELGYDNVIVLTGDGSEGLPDFAPYDCISVAAAAPKVPDPLAQELAEGGRMVVPVGRYLQELILVEKKNGKISTYPRGGVAFVPLIGKEGFKGG
ncbi:MAG: Protein-L-isoaspartate O-methyltransferase [Methanocella sp. PtaU1.Bin125]|nr:MAG: Protein-L-isoaspartate O-methyltransferase [Methanocella sp. PtaU1.Bin125]